MWTVEFHQRKGRAAPHDGQVDTLDEGQGGMAQVLAICGRANPLAAGTPESDGERRPHGG
jgi:hypothetical protein